MTKIGRASKPRALQPGGHSCKIAHPPVEYFIKQYDLEQGALEIQYIEEFFGEFPRKKMAAEIVRRLQRARSSDSARHGVSS